MIRWDFHRCALLVGKQSANRPRCGLCTCTGSQTAVLLEGRVRAPSQCLSKGCCAYTPQVLDSSQCTPFNACKIICLNEPPITACFYAIQTAFAAPLADCANAVSTWQA